MDIDQLLKLLSTLINKMIDKNLGRGVSSSKSVSPDEVKDLSVLPDKVEDLSVSPDEVEDVNTRGSSTGSVVPGDTACFNTMLQFINQLKSEIAGGSDAVLSDDEKETLREIVIECLAEEHTEDLLVIFQELDIKTSSLKILKRKP